MTAAASDSQTTPWTADFANWSFYLVLASAVLGLAVSLKYLAIRHRISKTIVHGRPGQISQYTELPHAAESSLSNQGTISQDIELGITLELIQPALPDAINRHANPLCNRPQTGPQEAGVSTEASQHAAGNSASFHAQDVAGPALTVAKATQSNFKLPPELLYDSQVGPCARPVHLSRLGSICFCSAIAWYSMLWPDTDYASFCHVHLQPERNHQLPNAKAA